ncbi:unnamed protein product [Xylocopa violacea]|uniref:EGF-like calcium-binding domain-containing protein n=1 Tax=Xylocopa violacea TaxID=135666 RepID=A0ABP1P254_XYLVO
MASVYAGERMKTISYEFVRFCVFSAFSACYLGGRITLPIRISRAESIEDGTERAPEAVPMTEQVMDANVKITDTPDLEKSIEERDASWDKNKIVRDVAYYIRAHKFQDFDRRYRKRIEDSPSRLYEEFPKPPLRSLHWEVRRHCDASFADCLKYLEGIIERTALRREDDTVTIAREQKWSLPKDAKQILAAEKDCRAAERRDSLTVVPFQGPIERFQWRTTVSYYMCWYTMLGVPELSIFGESCDNHADCRFESGNGNGDPRADDARPYACALYSFCPDHCCPIKQIREMEDCYQSALNPCYAENPPAHRGCELNREENQDFSGLLANRINVSCECRDPGYEWSARFGICVDANECTRGEHDCSTNDRETCLNLPGGYECVCNFGYLYDTTRRECVFSAEIDEMLAGSDEESNATETKNLVDAIVRTIARSFADRFAIDRAVLCATIAFAFVPS